MNIKKILLAFFLFIVTCSISTALADIVNPAVSDKNAAMINQKMHAFMQAHHISGAAVEVYIHGVPRAYYYGYANQAKKIPVTQHTIFEVGSFTKVFTCLLIAEEVEAGRLKLSDTLSQYVSDFAGSTVTVEELATHTAGFPLEVPASISTRSAFMRYYANWKPTAEIGSQWNYSNVGIGLLGYILESLTHHNYNQLYRDYILQPLGMQPIGVTVPKRWMPDYAIGYDDHEQVAPRIQDSVFPAAVGMKVSAGDMLHFLKAAIGLPGTPVLIAQAMRLTQTPYVETPGMQQGLAWEIYTINPSNMNAFLNPPTTINLGPLPARQLSKAEQAFNGDALIEKTGATAGFRAYMGVIPNRQSGIVILSNHRSINSNIVKLGRSILFACLSKH